MTYGNKSVDIVFTMFPATPADMPNLPQGGLSTPFENAALTVLALCYYPSNKELSLGMLEYLKGPAGLSPMEKQFLLSDIRQPESSNPWV